MRSGKSWIKRVLLIAVVIVVVGIGVKFASGGDVSVHQTAIKHVQLKDEPFLPRGDERSIGGMPRGEGRDIVVAGPEFGPVKAMRIDGHPREEWNAGVAIVGTILIAGLLFLILKRRKKSPSQSHEPLHVSAAAPMLTSTSDFLDQWERNHSANAKESN
ncbi:LPXTG cell wall anchor domain-containing protein [Paenibacillus sp. BC26]|uniref:LPXTG cell wall anchor domain-containing protein n=1 Tax=Paenibacillus sp. BC26 TaxID=1881032 RepID=UPI0008E5F3E7|nr:LPXTG cell wall anchor domain-containing protein [Paenibacillus sp. BC26]SFS54332.1 LPXTG-motif cell wall anchor domain-containing protein [Paenibacillus sp. BC26]